MCEKPQKIGKNRGFLPFKAKVYLDKIFFAKNMARDFNYEPLPSNSEILKQIRGGKKIVILPICTPWRGDFGRNLKKGDINT